MIEKIHLRLLALCLATSLLPSPARASGTDYQEGMKALAAGDYPAALQHLEQAVSDDPDNLRYGNDYRRAIIRSKGFDRGVQFLEKQVREHPNSANLHLNCGFSYVDKIPAAGSITQVILANNALNEFSKAVEQQPSWITYYTRGASYLFWPKVFDKASLGVADLEKAMEIQKGEPRHSYHVKTFIALGDGYWKIDQPAKARKVWRDGLKEFPRNAELKTRLSQQGEELAATIEAGFDPAKRVDTDLSELWSDSNN